MPSTILVTGKSAPDSNIGSIMKGTHCLRYTRINRFKYYGYHVIFEILPSNSVASCLFQKALKIESVVLAKKPRPNPKLN